MPPVTARPQVLYALTLVPVGLLADRVDRPRLLAGGIALWSLLTMAASETHSFGQARVCCCQQEQAEATREGRMAGAACDVCSSNSSHGLFQAAIFDMQ